MYEFRVNLELNVFWAVIGRVFANDPEDRGSIADRAIRKSQKWFLIPICLTLSIISYVSRVKLSNPRKGVAPPLHIGVIAIGRVSFGSPSTTVADFTYFIG